MKSLRVVVIALAVASCSKPAPPAPAPPASFAIGEIAPEDTGISGCMTMLSRTDASPTAGNLFIEDGVDQGAVGVIRIDGALIKLTLTAASRAGDNDVRTFADAAHTVTVVETTAAGAAHEASDSVERTGTVAVTAHGATQTVAVTGGTAC